MQLILHLLPSAASRTIFLTFDIPGCSSADCDIKGFLIQIVLGVISTSICFPIDCGSREECFLLVSVLEKDGVVVVAVGDLNHVVTVSTSSPLSVVTFSVVVVSVGPSPLDMHKILIS